MYPPARAEENGYFRYDMDWPPLCVAPQDGMLHTAAAVSTPPSHLSWDTVHDFLRESWTQGLKHQDAVLRTGLHAGEAAMLYLRRCGKPPSLPPVGPTAESARVQQDLVQALNTRLNIRCEGSHVLSSLFRHHFSPTVTSPPLSRRKLEKAFRKFLSESQKKTKKNIGQVRQLLQDLQTRYTFVQAS